MNFSCPFNDMTHLTPKRRRARIRAHARAVWCVMVCQYVMRLIYI
jgi:hypothetical protein